MKSSLDQAASVRQIEAIAITAKNFRPYGQLITATADGKSYDAEDAQLSLQNGTPRFYIMRLHQRGRRFTQITRHQQCTQCLGALEGKEWFIAVAPPENMTQPELEEIVVFRVPGNCFIKLETGTWHAGPFFDQDWIDFYNLELSDTNLADHETHSLQEIYGVALEII